ncbi:MAG: hypothetical protein ACK511_17115, partial [Burkholderiales bacterium]
KRKFVPIQVGQNSMQLVGQISMQFNIIGRRAVHSRPDRASRDCLRVRSIMEWRTCVMLSNARPHHGMDDQLSPAPKALT